MTEPAWAVHLPSSVNVRTLDLVAKRSLPAAWGRSWARNPGAIVLLNAEAGGGITARELDERSARVAGRFGAAGLSPGDRIIFSANTSTKLVIAHVAALRMGLVVVPVNVAYRQREIEHIARDCTPRAAVVDDPQRARWIIESGDPTVRIIGPDVSLSDGPVPSLDWTTEMDPGLICYTSGTTGSPKGAVLRHGNLLATAEAVSLAWRWSDEDRLVLALPIFHVHGLCVGLHGTLLTGGSVVLLPRFDVDTVLDTVASHRASLFFGVPTMYSRLGDSPRLKELAALRLCVSGSASLPPALFDRILIGSGQHVLERYGMTETLMNVSNPYDGERRPGTVGFPLPGVDLRLKEGAVSEILLRGPNVFDGYWNRAEATREAFVQGWFQSGDLGTFDSDGYLRIVGRSKEMIITGGLNVYPREIEDVLLEHPDIAEAAVVGTTSDEWGQTVTAFIVPRSHNLTADQVSEFVHEHLAGYKRPRIVHFVDSLPRNALGKVVKGELVK